MKMKIFHQILKGMAMHQMSKLKHSIRGCVKWQNVRRYVNAHGFFSTFFYAGIIASGRFFSLSLSRTVLFWPGTFSSVLYHEVRLWSLLTNSTNGMFRHEIEYFKKTTKKCFATEYKSNFFIFAQRPNVKAIRNQVPA